MKPKRCNKCGCERIFLCKAELIENITGNRFKLNVLCFPCMLTVIKIDIWKWKDLDQQGKFQLFATFDPSEES